MTLQEAIGTLEAWYTNRCDDDWEHRFGVKIESTDNPGWWLAIEDCIVDDIKLAPIVGPLLEEFGAQVTKDATTIRVFSRSLENCIIASAVVLNRVSAKD